MGVCPFFLKLAACGLALFGLHSNSSPWPYFKKLVRWAELPSPVHSHWFHHPLLLSLLLSPTPPSLSFDGAVEELLQVFPSFILSLGAHSFMKVFQGAGEGTVTGAEHKVFPSNRLSGSKEWASRGFGSVLRVRACRASGGPQGLR